MTWSVSEQRQVFGAYWALLSTTDGVTRTVAVFYGDEAERMAKRCRDLLIRNGTEDVPLPRQLENP